VRRVGPNETGKKFALDVLSATALFESVVIPETVNPATAVVPELPKIELLPTKSTTLLLSLISTGYEKLPERLLSETMLLRNRMNPPDPSRLTLAAEVKLIMDCPFTIYRLSSTFFDDVSH